MKRAWLVLRSPISMYLLWARAFFSGHRAWVVKSLTMNAMGAATDYAVLLTARNAFDLHPALAAAMGLAVGSTVSFCLNRRFTFVDAQGAAGQQALRFALTVSVLIAMHATAVNFLCESFALHVVLAKMIADITVVPVPQAFLLRRFVFPPRRPQSEPQPAAVPVALQS